MQPKTLGRRLRRLRKMNGETQKEFAENFGRHYRTVQNWELDHSVPDVFTAMALAEYYNMSVEELVDGEDDYDKELYRSRRKISRIDEISQRQTYGNK